MIIGWVATALGVAFAAASIALRWPWFVRASVFGPAAMAAVCFLQAARRTCIARASEGTFENEDFSTTKAPDDEVVASREVAGTIKRDALVIGLVASVALAVTAFSR